MGRGGVGGAQYRGGDDAHEVHSEEREPEVRARRMCGGSSTHQAVRLRAGAEVTVQAQGMGHPHPTFLLDIMQIARSMIVPTFDQDRRVSAVSTRLEAQIAPQLPLSSIHRYTDVRCNGRDLDKGKICSGCDVDAHGQSIDVVGDGSGAGAGARWSAGKDDGRLPCIATYRLICLTVSWLGLHPISQHTLFEAASRLDLGYEYVGTRSSSIGERPPQLAHNVIVNQRLYDYRSRLCSCKHLAFLIGARSDARMHLLITCLHTHNSRNLLQFTYASHRLPLYCDPSTEEGGDDKGRAGVLIMNSDMLIPTADTG
ncbi:hypothetical protein B0H13DRAFT_1888674 [Mycena leptocephala]|nr:hypothetical protein B0H13DRAFT_1888674 [Mycena leptocephala]